MTGCVALRKDVYYIRLTYYDRDHKRKDKWVSTGLSGRGAKQKATAMIDSFIEKYSYLEKSDHPSKIRKSTVGVAQIVLPSKFALLYGSTRCCSQQL